MKYFLKFLVCIVLLTSCTIRQEYDFTSNEEGRYKLELDISSMSALMGESEEGDYMKSALDSFDMDSLAEVMNKIDGISNTKIITDNDIISFGYDFSSLESLNESMQGNSISSYLNKDKSKGTSSTPILSTKGKKMMYKMPVFEPKSEVDLESYSGMASMMKYEVVFKFDKPIKKVSNDNYIISMDKKTITYKSNFEDIFKGLLDSDVTIKLK